MKVRTITFRGVKKIIYVSVLLALLLSLGAGSVLAVPPGDPLRTTADGISRADGDTFLIGFAASNDFLKTSTATNLAKAEFNFVTCENAMKMEYTWKTSENTAHDFSGADPYVTWAEQNNMLVHGHALVWHSQKSTWLNKVSKDDITRIMHKHIDAMLDHYKGRIAVWDVVNEAWADGGGSPRTSSVWYESWGNNLGFIEEAFKYTRQKADSLGDTDMQLIYNDFNLITDDAKFDAMYKYVKENLVDKYKSNPIIDGIGFQGHLTSDDFARMNVSQKLTQKMQKLADIGLDTYITELDIRFPKQNGTCTLPNGNNLQQQAQMYKQIMDACLAQPSCKAVQIWGIPDNQSWINLLSNFNKDWCDPLVFDNSYQPKPAYRSVQESLKNAPKTQGPAAYVKQGANGTKDGSSWQNAYPTLQDALAKVTSGEIWVAKGVYYTDEGGGQVNNNRDATFQLKNGVAIYGGFVGTETSRDTRNATTHLTVLSGDIEQDDTTDTNKIVQKPPHPAYNPPNPADMTSDIKGNNAYHVVSGINVTRTALLDGFIITAGYGGEGGGLRNDNGSPTLNNLSFHGNYATWGGGMGNFNHSSPVVLNVTFSGNSAMSGGGMYNDDSNPIVDNSVFSGNWAVTGAGMMSNASGVHYDPARDDFAYVVVRNSTFAGNYARSSPVYGAAVQDENSIVVYSNCIVWGNSHSSMNVYSVGSMGGFSSSNVQNYKVFSNGMPTDWDIYQNRGPLTNTKVDPKFVNPIDPSQAPTTAGNYRLQKSSPAIDAGNTMSVTMFIDHDNNWRVTDGELDGNLVVDMGAYEYYEAMPINLPYLYMLPLLWRGE